MRCATVASSSNNYRFCCGECRSRQRKKDPRAARGASAACADNDASGSIPSGPATTRTWEDVEVELSSSTRLGPGAVGGEDLDVGGRGANALELAIRRLDFEAVAIFVFERLSNAKLEGLQPIGVRSVEVFERDIVRSTTGTGMQLLEASLCARGRSSYDGGGRGRRDGGVLPAWGEGRSIGIDEACVDIECNSGARDDSKDVSGVG